MPSRSAEQAAQRAVRTRPPQAAPRRPAKHDPRMPSTVGYMVSAMGLSFSLFWAVWFVLRAGGEESPWLPAGLVAGSVILAAAAAREFAMRRAWARYAREMERVMAGGDVLRAAPQPAASANTRSSIQASVAALRKLQQRLAELEAGGAPEAHLEAYRLCEQYLVNTEDVLRAGGVTPETRVAIRSNQERVRPLQRRHLLAWARGETTRLTNEAQRRVRTSDKIETAHRALEVLGEALKVYPDEQDLQESAAAVRDFIASLKVGRWVEMAERSAFRGMYARAIARYRDALFYLSRAEMSEDARDEAATRIQREIELLRARLATTDGVAGADMTPPDEGPGRVREKFLGDA